MAQSASRLGSMFIVLGAIALWPVAGLAENYPSRPIKIIVPYAPGGVVDGLARVLSVSMKESLGQPVIVENRAGGGGIIGMQACATAPADGHTLCMTVQDSLSYNPYLYTSLPYDAEKGFTAITNLGWTNGLIVAAAKSGLNSYADMVAASRSRPGSLNWGTWGDASQPDILLRAIEAHEDIRITAIPYKGAGGANPALLAGEIDLTYMGIGGAQKFIEDGRLKPIALTGKQRVASLPGIPTLAELGADPGLPSYMALFAPAGVSKPVAEQIHAAIVRAAQTPLAQQFYRTYTMTFVGDTPAAFAEFVRRDQATAAAAFRRMGFKPGDR